MKSVRGWNCILRNDKEKIRAGQMEDGRRKFHRTGKAMKKHGNLREAAFLLPSLAGVFIFVFCPFADVVRRSFVNVAGKEFTGFHNYKMVLENKAFQLAAGNTLKFLLVCVPLLLAVSLLLANVVYFGGMKLYRDVCLLPMAIPVVSLTFVWRMIFHRNGLLNSYLGTTADWLNVSSAFWVLIGSFLWKNTGYYVVLWLAGLEGIPKELYEAAAVDGADFWTRFRYITLPGLKPVCSAAFVLAITGALKSYRESYLLSGEYPHKSIYMIPHLMHNWFRDMSMEKMSAAAVLLVLLFAGLVWPFRKKGGGNLDSLGG